MSTAGNLLTSFEGNPSFSLLDVVKNPALQRQINGALTQNAANNSQAQSYLSDYISQYLNNEGAQRQRTNQQVASLDQYYNGQMASQLAGLRAAQQQATVNAAQVATQQALRGLNLGRLGQQGSGSSYDARMAIGAMQPIQVQAALTNANQARVDLGYLTQLQQMGLGQGQNLVNAQAAYRLAPIAAMQNVYSNNLNNLAGIANLYNANNIYGAQQNKTDLDKWANFVNTANTNTMQMAQLAGSVAGAMMGTGGGMGGGMGGLAGAGQGYQSPNYGYGSGRSAMPAGTMWEY